MANKKVIFIGIGAALLAGIGIYFAVTKLGKKKEEEEAPEADNKQPVSQELPTPKGPKIILTKAAAKAKDFVDKTTSAPKTESKPVATKPGQKIYVYAKAEGAKAYNKPSKAGVNLGSLYNSYNRGKIIGTYAGATSIGGEKYLRVNDGNTPLLIMEKLTYTKTV